ncbi:hypothetical protein ABLE91_05670 [Aquabacter sp. CN5-332]|uniref:hypothetical protein n=1 Tax=Aquabacter sp. CN5-332 TaxID=3156608 RepID=UPI0032B4625C
MTDWKKPLAHTITLKGRGSGTLSTLEEAGRFLLGNSKGVLRNDVLAHAMTLLMQAAESGDQVDIAEATTQLERYLTAQRMM